VLIEADWVSGLDLRHDLDGDAPRVLDLADLVCRSAALGAAVDGRAATPRLEHGVTALRALGDLRAGRHEHILRVLFDEMRPSMHKVCGP